MMHAVLMTLLGVSLIQADESVQLRCDASEAEAVLAIVAKRQAAQPVTEEEWQRLFATVPYQRLKQREEGLAHSFTDEAFKQFVLSDDLAGRIEQLRHTLDQWRSCDLQASARRVSTYLPPQARIRAAVYPVIKPQTNSGVTDLRRDAAILLYLDSEQSAAKFESTVAHELHHIGYGSVAQDRESNLASYPVRIRTAVEWMGAFGVGFAMLAAAGDSDTHPHALSPAAERTRWDRDMANVNDDLRKREDFFLDIVDGRLTAEEDGRLRAFSFFGEQGPWYTVGYRIATVVERCYGRAMLIDCMLNPQQLLRRYNTAAAELNMERTEQLALWSNRLLQQIGAL